MIPAPLAVLSVLSVADSGGHAGGEGVGDDRVVGVGNLVDIALEGELPVFDRPPLRVLHRGDDRNCRQPVGLVENEQGLDRDAEGIILARLLRVLALPDRRVVIFPEVGRHLDDAAECLRARHVVDEGVARVHLLGLLAVAGFDALHRPSQRAALCDVAG
jgi:hypothetical protein